MKIGICGDIHWSTYSSIIRSRGVNFSTRLEDLIKSLSWVEQTFKDHGCEEEVFLGDFFDKPDLTAEEISALSEVNWCNNPRIRHFIVGNHESGIISLKYNSTQILHKNGVIEDTPYLYPLDDKTDFLFLPYITEDERKSSIADYVKNRQPNKKLVVFSHNDIKNFQMGPFLSKTGFDIADIESHCNLYFNGHLHNEGRVSNTIINVGVLSGQNFSEDAFKYSHHIVILDTDTLEIEFIENPYAFNFYKLDITTEEDIQKISQLKDNAVVSIKCSESCREALLNELSKNKCLIYKVIYTRDATLSNSSTSVEELNNKNHLEQFVDYILNVLGSSEVVQTELTEVCK